MWDDLLHEWHKHRDYLVPAIGVMAGLIVFLLGQAILSRTGRKKQLVPRAVVDREYFKEDPFRVGSPGDKRAAARRKGNPVSILISDAAAEARPYPGLVVDRSTGGLCVLADKAVEVGTILSVRAANAPSTVPWVQVEVKNSRGTGNQWELGCQFVKTPPWSVLLLFG
jgi:hypothetical protein